tara:strand:- start:1393 stop:1599 length:207 start_codon:yes stop_codon:yes gene_type:complete
MKTVKASKLQNQYNRETTLDSIFYINITSKPLLSLGILLATKLLTKQKTAQCPIVSCRHTNDNAVKNN